MTNDEGIILNITTSHAAGKDLDQRSRGTVHQIQRTCKDHKLSLKQYPRNRRQNHGWRMNEEPLEDDGEKTSLYFQYSSLFQEIPSVLTSPEYLQFFKCQDILCFVTTPMLTTPKTPIPWSAPLINNSLDQRRLAIYTKRRSKLAPLDQVRLLIDRIVLFSSIGIFFVYFYGLVSLCSDESTMREIEDGVINSVFWVNRSLLRSRNHSLEVVSCLPIPEKYTSIVSCRD